MNAPARGTAAGAPVGSGASGTERVVVTGLGAITPSGQDVETVWKNVVAGRSAITELEGEPFANLAVRIGGQITDFDAEAVVPRSLARRLSPVQLWALAAADQALASAGIDPARAKESAGAGSAGAAGEGESGDGAGTLSAGLPWDRNRIAVIAATGSGPVDAMQSATLAFETGGPRSVPLTLAIHGAPDSAAALISQRFDIRGPAQGVSATCASGAIGLGEGLRRIRHGYADAVLVIGMEDCLNPINLSSNANMRALAAGFEGDPASACKPFDRARSGFVMSQGAAAILLESASSAQARGAEVVAELAGFGAASDAFHPTSPHPEGRGAASAVTEALRDAGLRPDDIDHINAHATATSAGDAAELAAFDASLGERGRRIPISATKSTTGHHLGAAGIVEAIIAMMTLRERTLPPTINLTDPEFDGWDFVAGDARPLSDRLDTVLSTSFGFGGHNGAIVLRRATA